MANFLSANASGRVQGPSPMGQEAAVLRASIAVSASQFVTTNVFEMGELPVGCKVIDWTVDTDDLDTGGSPAVVFKVGVLNAGKTDLDTGNNIWATGLTTAQAGGLARMATQAPMRLAASDTPRMIGIVPTTNPATGASGTIGITVYLKAA